MSTQLLLPQALILKLHPSSKLYRNSYSRVISATADAIILTTPFWLPTRLQNPFDDIYARIHTVNLKARIPEERSLDFTVGLIFILSSMLTLQNISIGLPTAVLRVLPADQSLPQHSVHEPFRFCQHSWALYRTSCALFPAPGRPFSHCNLPKGPFASVPPSFRQSRTRLPNTSGIRLRPVDHRGMQKDLAVQRTFTCGFIKDDQSRRWARGAGARGAGARGAGRQARGVVATGIHLRDKSKRRPLDPWGPIEDPREWKCQIDTQYCTHWPQRHKNGRAFPRLLPRPLIKTSWYIG